MLTSRYRLGEFWHDGEWHKGSHPATQSEDTWLAAHALAAKGDSYGPTRGGRKPPLHLFTHGLLRCIHCYEAMLPRSDSDTYRCRTRAQIKGDDGCIMPNLPRAEVDRQALELFERLFLDLDATREQFAADLNAHLEEVETQQQRAAREAAERAVQIARVERDYLAGDLTAATYERLSAQLEQDHAAANAEQQRLAANADAVRVSRAELDAESAVLHRLADLRVSLLERVRSAEQQADVDALRTALAQTHTALHITADGRILGGDPRPGQPFGHHTPIPMRDRSTTLIGSGVPE